MDRASQARIPDGAAMHAEKYNYNYNDLACNLLSEIMGRVTGTPYDDFVELALLQPLKLELHHAQVPLGGDPGETELRKSAAINGRKPASLPDVTNPVSIDAMCLHAYALLQN